MIYWCRAVLLLNLAIVAGCGARYTALPDARTPVVVVKGDLPKHGFLGASFGDGPNALLVVERVIPGTGAADVGLAAGDVVLAVDDQSVHSTTQLMAIMRRSRPGDFATMLVRRANEDARLKVRLMSYAEVLVLEETHFPTVRPR